MRISDWSSDVCSSDLDMAEALITRSYETLSWMRGKGVRFQPIWGRQAFKVDGRFKFWGGLTVEAWGGGPGLVEALWQAAARNGIEIRFSSRVLDRLYDDVAVTGGRGKGPNGDASIKAKAEDRKRKRLKASH